MIGIPLKFILYHGLQRTSSRLTQKMGGKLQESCARTFHARAKHKNYFFISMYTLLFADMSLIKVSKEAGST